MNSKQTKINSKSRILAPGSRVINAGLAVFEEALTQQGVQVISVQSKPSYKIAPDLKLILDDLI